MPRRSFLSTVGAAIAAGLLKLLPAKSAGSTSEDMADKPEAIASATPPIQNTSFDERLFGHGLPIEQANNGREYVVVEGKPLVLMPSGDVYADIDPETPVVLTEDGLRVVDVDGDLTSKEGMMIQLWKDPSTGRMRPLTELPQGGRLIDRSRVEFVRDGQVHKLPILVRAWRKGDPE